MVRGEQGQEGDFQYFLYFPVVAVGRELIENCDEGGYHISRKGLDGWQKAQNPGCRDVQIELLPGFAERRVQQGGVLLLWCAAGKGDLAGMHPQFLRPLDQQHMRLAVPGDRDIASTAADFSLSGKGGDAGNGYSVFNRFAKWFRSMNPDYMKMMKADYYFQVFLYSASSNPTVTRSPSTAMGRFTNRPLEASRSSACASVISFSLSLMLSSLYCTPLVLNSFLSSRVLRAFFRTVLGGGVSVMSID